MTQDATDSIRLGVGMRLKAARENKGLTQDAVSQRFDISKKTVSAWETGRGDPGIYRLRELAKLYDVSADALLWEDSLTPEAMKIAASFDSLTVRQQATLSALWMAYVTESATDQQVEVKMPVTKKTVGNGS